MIHSPTDPKHKSTKAPQDEDEARIECSHVFLQKMSNNLEVSKFAGSKLPHLGSQLLDHLTRM